MIRGRWVVLTAAAALCPSLMVSVLGASAAEAAVQSKSGVTVAVTVSPPTEVYGVLDQVFSVTIAPPASGDISPTGVVTVSDLQVDLCPPISLPASGVGAVTVICADSTVPIPVNSSTIAAYSYSGDQNYLASKGRVSGAVTAADTTTTVTASSATATWGSEHSLVFSATVDDSQSGSVGVPTGDVSIEQGSSVLCTVTLSNGSGTCSPAATALPPGTYPITASYGGDSNFNPSPLSAPVTLAISPASLLVTGDEEAMPYGSSLPALGSAISGFVNGQSLATSGVTGQSQCTTDATITSPVGTYPITCTAGSLASPDYSFEFAPGTLTVSRAPTAISLSSLTATVSAKYSGAPTGSVTFLVAGGSYSCTLSTQSAISASCAASVKPNTPSGNYSVMATYSGDANFTSSSSSGELTVSNGAAPGAGDTGTGSGTSSAPGGVGHPYPTSLATTPAELLASAESSARTNEEDVSVYLQTQAQLNNEENLRKYIAFLLQGQTAATASGQGSTQGHATSGPLSSQGAKSAGLPANGDSTATAGGSSSNRVNTSLVVSKSGPLVPVLILTFVLGFCVLTAIEVRRRIRRAAEVSAGDSNDASATDSDEAG
jgi:hypothetical protein